MKTAAVVPVKDLSQAKTRLAGSLPPEERVALSKEMLAHVLAALDLSGLIKCTAVITPDRSDIDLPYGVARITQERDGLNALLEQGREWAAAQKADALMVVFADLPLLSPYDIKAVLRLGQRENTVVLAPDRRDMGTNLLLSHPLSLAPFAFGEGSYEKHLIGAAEAGARIEVYGATGTALDIDTPEDLAFLLSLGSGTREPLSSK